MVPRPKGIPTLTFVSKIFMSSLVESRINRHCGLGWAGGLWSEPVPLGSVTLPLSGLEEMVMVKQVIGVR